MDKVATRFHGPETQDAFLADRQNFFDAFIKASTGMIIFLVLLLIAMGLFL